MKRRKAPKPLQPKAPKATTAIFDQANEVRAIARERVGTVKPSKAILPKADRKKPKHKKSPAEDANGL
jgi:hypothetical protein